MSQRALEAAQERAMNALMELQNSIFDVQIASERLQIYIPDMRRFDRLLIDVEQRILLLRGAYERALVREQQAKHIVDLINGTAKGEPPNET